MFREYDCLIPAAGRSSRMGRWKPLLTFDDSTLIETVVSTALQACGTVILVGGYRGDELEKTFKSNGRVKIVENPDWEDGMLSSIQAGIREISSAKFFIVPGDMPFLNAEVYQALVEASVAAHDKAPATEAVIPEYKGRRGHPVLIDSSVIPRVTGAAPVTRSMREILSEVHCEYMPWTDDTILKDIDTPEEYERDSEGSPHDET